MLNLNLLCTVLLCLIFGDSIFVFAKSVDFEVNDEADYERAQTEVNKDWLEPAVRYKNVCGGIIASDKSPIEISIKLKDESKKCVWTIEAPEDHRVELFYHSMGCITAVADCTKDNPYFFMIYDGSNEKNSNLVYDSRTNGAKIPPFVSSGRKVIVELYYRDNVRIESNISYELALRFRYA